MTAIGLLLIPLFGLLFMGIANAHDGDSSVVYLDVFPNGEAQGQIEHPVGLLNELFDLDLDLRTATADDIAAIEVQVRAYNADNLAIVGDDGTEWRITFTGEVAAIETENEVYAAFEFDVENRFESAPRRFDVTFNGIVDDATHFAAVVMRTDPVTGTFLNEGEAVPGFIDASSPTLSINLDDPDRWKAFTGTVGLGMDHIFIGTDHILFVLVLLLPAVMVFSMADGWGPVPTFRDGLWRVLKIATMFTVAHSITLTLGGLEIVELPSKLVETVIALSIIATAFHNLRPIFANREHLIAFAFGIFHGFGFAGLLSELGVGRGQRLLTLLGFNVGVEIGQAFIIMLIFPALFLLRRTTMYKWVLRIGSIVLAGIASIWALERIFETELGIDSFLEKFTRAPRVFVLVAVATVLAAVIRSVESRRGRLAPVSVDDVANDQMATEGEQPALV
ncbi:MAG: hypothetical protein ACI81L_000917 [Verrucomicrobiales bacterium]|jgi:hypothetical protein